MNGEEKTVRCAHTGGFHDMVYSAWGPADAPRCLVCVHGLTRNGRDFDRLAERLTAGEGLRLLAPDVVGRGRSDRLGPYARYEIPQYVQDLTVLLAAEGRRDVDWLGTSMGGLIGMTMAAMAQTPIRRMLINDVGPLVPKAALERIAEYVGVGWRFDSFDKAVDHIRRAYAPFGLTSENDWRYLAELSLDRDADGAWINAYDPRIAEPLREGPLEDVDLWALWDAIGVPITVLRGAESDLLTPETATEMSRRGPCAEVIEVPGCGHAPALMQADQIALVEEWLRDG
jgi:pimeloyl-ACP methyl ester carboxylesterase